jgi:hypothetical protein
MVKQKRNTLALHRVARTCRSVTLLPYLNRTFLTILKRLLNIEVSVIGCLGLMACASNAFAQAAPDPPIPVYRDPFSYCKGIGDNLPPNPETNIATLDRRYEGPATPKEVIAAVGHEPVTWRCMDGAVYGCYIGASGQGCMRPDTRPLATSEMKQFCSQNPGRRIPNAYNNSIYDWMCNGPIPSIGATPPPALDRMGFYQSTWIRVGP